MVQITKPQLDKWLCAARQAHLFRFYQKALNGTQLYQIIPRIFFFCSNKFSRITNSGLNNSSLPSYSLTRS